MDAGQIVRIEYSTYLARSLSLWNSTGVVIGFRITGNSMLLSHRDCRILIVASMLECTPQCFRYVVIQARK